MLEIVNNCHRQFFLFMIEVELTEYELWAPAQYFFNTTQLHNYINNMLFNAFV